MDNLIQAIRGNEILRVLKNRAFFFLMVSEFFSQIAFNMEQFVLIFIIYELSNSNTAVSGLILSFTIPAIIFSISAGVFVDRWNKRNVLFITNLLRGILLLFFLIPGLHIGFIYTLTFCIAVATQFFLPAESAIIPLLVRPQQLVAANAVFAIGIYSTVLIGYIASGPIKLLLGKNVTFIILAVLFFMSALCILFVKNSQEKKKADSDSSPHVLRESYIKDISEVVHFIRKAQVVTRALIVLTISQAITFTFAVLGPGYMSTILDVDIEQLSIILLGPAAIGMVLGSLFVGSLGKRFRGKNTIGTGFLITGLVFLFLPLGNKVASQGITHTINLYLPHIFDITSVHIIVLLAFIAGIANSFIFIPSNFAIQRYTSENIRGRIYGFLNALVGAVSLLPVVIAGGLADLLGIVTVIIGIGIILLILGTLAITVFT